MDELLKRRIAWLEDHQARMVRKTVLWFTGVLILIAIAQSLGPQQVPSLFDPEATPLTRLIFVIRVGTAFLGLIAYCGMLLLEVRIMIAVSVACLQTMSRLPTSQLIELAAQMPMVGRRRCVRLLWARGVLRKEPMALAFLKGDEISNLPDGRGMEWNDLFSESEAGSQTSTERAGIFAGLLMILAFLAPLLLGAWEFWRSIQVLQGNQPYEALSPVFKNLTLVGMFFFLGVASIIALFDAYKRDKKPKRKMTFDDRLNQWLSGDWSARIELRRMARFKQNDPQVLATRDRLGLEKSKDPGLRELWPLLRKSDFRPPLESQIANPASE